MENRRKDTKISEVSILISEYEKKVQQFNQASQHEEKISRLNIEI